MRQQTTALRSELSRVSAALDQTGEQVKRLADDTAREAQRFRELAGALDRLTQDHGHDLARLSDGLAAVQGNSSSWARAEHPQALEVRLAADLEAVREQLVRLAEQQRQALAATVSGRGGDRSQADGAPPRGETEPAEAAGGHFAGSMATGADATPDARPVGSRPGQAAWRHRNAIPAPNFRGNDPAPRPALGGYDDPDRVEL